MIVRPKSPPTIVVAAPVSEWVPSDVECDASDYERPMRPGEWIPMPHADSPEVK